jgi:hypothetical protein
MFAAVSGSLAAPENERDNSTETAELGRRLGEVGGWLLAAVAALGSGK